MIKRNKYLIKFEDNLSKNNNFTLNQKYKILDCMYFLALELGRFKKKYKIKDLKIDIKIAKVINSV